MKKILFSLLSIIIVSSCYKETYDPLADCPTLNDEVSWDKYPYTYGKVWSQFWPTTPSGFYPGDGTSDDGNTHLVPPWTNNCGWKIYGTETGGTGNTYAVYLPPDTALIFRWAWQSLTQFVLSSKWRGQTSKGIRMGDTRSKFLSAYPYFKVNSSNPSVYEFIKNQTPSTVRAYFTDDTPNGKLKLLKIATGYII